MSQFVQIHAFCSYPGTLLNRDDVGFAKRLPFGGTTRTRISSQCLKRHWRTFDGEDAISRIVSVDDSPIELSVRSRITFQKLVIDPLVAEGRDPERVRAATERVIAKVLGQSKQAKADKAEAAKPKKGKKGEAEAAPAPVEALQTNQVTVIGPAELRYFKGLVDRVVQSGGPVEAGVDEALKDAKKNIEALKRAAGIDAALFGRMVTGDVLAQGDAAVHVAHAFTVHGETVENDYFSAVDDLLKGGDEAKLGSGHIGSVELTSGLYYIYVVVDVALLVSNLEGVAQKNWREADRRLAGEVVSRLVKLIATVSPGAKKGSTAPYAYADAVLVEVGSRQPRTLANAFQRAVDDRELLPATYSALGRHLAKFDLAYGRKEERRLMAVDLEGLTEDEQKGLLKAAGESVSLDALASWVRAQVVEACG
ncbi:MAG: type I-E CRISPR-associated protein Cas7/Cse4/CasC [Deltaproteobacteria bacterium]|nr:type I-E CRISPR-associated protein Cas7/Cse4/CasC [Deltaproteobacteria bacterium]